MDCNTPPAVEITDLKQARVKQLADRISELCAYIYAAEHRLLTLIREFDEREGWQALGFPNCAAWLNFKCGIDNSEPVPNSTADRYQVVVHVGAESPHLEDGSHVSADQVPSGQTSRRIACECSFVRVGEAEDGEPLSIGRRSRTSPPAIRRALRLRDGGCRFPGCTNNRFVDGHHIEHWADGGETSLENVVTLCRHHHHLVHEGGFTCERTPQGEIVFRDERNSDLPEWMELPSVDEADIEAWLDREFFEQQIDSETCRSQWFAGERLDWDMAVGHLHVSAETSGLSGRYHR